MNRILGADEPTLRHDRTSVKWRAYPADVLPLWVAEMDAAPCPAVVDAVTDAMRRGDTGYGYAPGYLAALSRYARDAWGWRFSPSRAQVVTDVMIGLSEMLRLLTPEGGTVIVSPPVYDSFFGFVEAIGRRRLDAPLTAAGRLDLERLESAFAEATAGGGAAAYLLCNPQNPTGAVHTVEELSALAALAERHGVRVVSDEIHGPLTLPGATFTPYLTVPGAERGVTAFSPSKGWNLAGLKSAVVVAGPEAVADLARLHEVHTHGSSHLGEIAHVAAVTEGRAWQAQLVGEIGENLDLLERLLAEQLPQVVWRRPQATYLTWLDCRGLGLGDDPAAHFLTHGRVALGHGPRYGSDAGRGFVRLNVATSPGILEEAVLRMVSALRVRP